MNQCYASEKISKENYNTTHIYIITVNDKPIKLEEIYEDSTRKGEKKILPRITYDFYN
jgi:hypothetical protein